LAWLPNFLPFIFQHVSMMSYFFFTRCSQIDLKLIEALDLWKRGMKSGDSGDKCRRH